MDLDPPPPPPDSPTPALESSIGPVKEKKKRNRQRLSCTECAKRRQKCDRQRPCGLCVSRGVQALCRWDNNSIQAQHIQNNASQPELIQTIDTLNARIVALEASLQNAASSPPTQLSSHPPPSAPPNPHIDPALSSAAPVYPSPRFHPSPTDNNIYNNDSVYQTAVRLAQMSLVSGAGEFTGHGTVVCSLHRMVEGESRYPYVQSTALYARTAPHAQSIAITALCQRLPPRPECDSIIVEFFNHHNFRFGIPEVTFRRNYEQMWSVLARNDNVQVNPHWLGLLYSALAYSVQDPAIAARYFQSAVEARRISEDMLMAPAFTPLGQSTPSASADGAALGCLAAVVQGTYLSDRGMVSEGWKVVGNAIRNAFAIGMHRDPSWRSWSKMNEDELILRRRAFWSLVVFDRLYSYILGRPATIQPDQFDVVAPDDTKRGYCSYGVFEQELVKLSSIVGDALRTCMGIRSPSMETVNEVNSQFDKWEANLPVQFRWRLPATEDNLRNWAATYRDSTRAQGIELDPSSAANELTVLRHRHTLATWFLGAKIALHRQFIMPYMRMGGSCARISVDPPDISSRPHSDANESLTVELCMEMCAVQVAGHGADANFNSNGSPKGKVLPGKIAGFVDSFFLFDCAVTLMLALCSFRPGDPRTRMCHDGVERAGSILSNLAKTTPNDPQGDIARRAIAVLLVLKRYQEKLLKSMGANMAQNQAPAETPNGDIAVDGSRPTQNSGNASDGASPFNRPASSVATPYSHERYSRYLEDHGAIDPSLTKGNPLYDMLNGVQPITSLLHTSSDPSKDFDFSFLDTFSFPDDPTDALRKFGSPNFDWGADWSTLQNNWTVAA